MPAVTESRMRIGDVSSGDELIGCGRQTAQLKFEHLSVTLSVCPSRNYLSCSNKTGKTFVGVDGAVASINCCGKIFCSMWASTTPSPSFTTSSSVKHNEGRTCGPFVYNIYDLHATFVRLSGVISM